MSDFLFQYQPVQPTTWVYLSSLLLIGLFFKFGRLWSVRNLDLLLLILLGPGLLMIHYGQLGQGTMANNATDLVTEGATESVADNSPSAEVDEASVDEGSDSPISRWQNLEGDVPYCPP